MSLEKCCGPAIPPCCDDPDPIDTRRRVGCVHRHATICDNCGAAMTMHQVHAAHGLHQVPARTP